MIKIVSGKALEVIHNGGCSPTTTKDFLLSAKPLYLTYSIFKFIYFGSFMATRYKPGTKWPRKAVFWTYTTAVNGTSIGWLAAGGIAAQTACDIELETVVRQGSVAIATYLIPGSIALGWVTAADKYYYLGKKALGYGSKAYNVAKSLTSPLSAINYVGGNLLTKTGLTETMKYLCGVEECDDFYWEKPQYSHID